MAIFRTHARLIFTFILFILTILSSSSAFQSDELDDEFVGLHAAAAADLTAARPPPRRRADPDSSGDSKTVQFSLEHALGCDGSAFSPAGTFTARLKSWAHGGQTLTKLRFSRKELTGDEEGAFQRILEEDGIYTIKVPSNVLEPRDFVLSSIRARCLVQETLSEHFVIHTDGVNILAVNYGSSGPCQYPRVLKLPTRWSFKSHMVLKNGEQAPRTPTFTEQLDTAEVGEGEGSVKPPEKSFWAKYWMYLIPLGFIVMNAVTQTMNMPEEQTPGQSTGQTQQGAAQRAPSTAVRRR